MTKRRLKNIFPSLRTQMLALLAVAIVAAMAIAFGGNRLMEQAINRWYLSDTATERRADTMAKKFAAYVDENDIAAADVGSIQQWTERERDATIVLDTDEGTCEIGWWGIAEMEENWRDAYRIYGYYPHTIAFADGSVEIGVSESSELRLYSLASYTSIVLGAGVLIAALLIFARRVTARLEVLSADVNAISEGDLEYPIYPTSNDELSRLARDVDRMRTRIIEQTQAEQNALQANSDLITALSHDIRNPLTSLIGYMELLEMEQDTLPAEAREYVRASLDKAYRIRDLTGELFRYFLVFGKQEDTLEWDDYDAQILLEQLLGEPIIELRSRGFQVEAATLDYACVLRTDVGLLKRVMDNLLSNLLKYADPDAPISFRAEADTQLIVTIENQTRTRRDDEVESNHIGLRTCDTILHLLGGTFEVEAADDRFIARCRLPIK